MLYLLYIFIGLLIIFGVNLMITGLLAVHDMYTRRDDEEPTFDTFKELQDTICEYLKTKTLQDLINPDIDC